MRIGEPPIVMLGEGKVRSRSSEKIHHEGTEVTKDSVSGLSDVSFRVERNPVRFFCG